MQDKQLIVKALTLPEFEDWESELAEKHLKRPRRRPEHLPGEGRIGAVMLLLYPSENSRSLNLVLTRRQPDLSHHGGQISLPGGRQEGNESLVQTALRETAEEIGIAVEHVQILGQLNPLYIPPSDFTIHPFVGWYEGLPRFTMAVEEVAEIIEAPIEELASPAVLQFGKIESENLEFEAGFYRISEFQVWGATAMVINEFLVRLKAAGCPD